MEIHVMQEQVNKLSAAMVAKGLRQPRAEFRIGSNVEWVALLAWKPFSARDDVYVSDTYEWIRGGTEGEILAKADAFIAALPDAEQHRRQEFLTALGNVIDLGRQHNIDVEYVNPLVASMKKLSENVITDQRAA